MKITFLGTSAGEEYPCAWCECENCAKARKWGGKNIRRNSCVILDSDVMIDMGKTAHIQAEKFNINLRGIKTLLVTHSHKDHFNTHTLWTRCAASPPPRFLEIFGGRQVREALLSNDRFDAAYWQVGFNPVEPFKKYFPADLAIYTLDGNHDDGKYHRAINYIIMRKNITFAYLSDTGWPFDETLEALKNYKYDFIISEGTAGFSEGSATHMDISQNVRLLEFFNANKLWKNEPDYYITHVSPVWCPPHDEYEPVLKSKGMKLAYDGMVIEYLYD
jgi:phosphoribosyl 1,2-cyclic phosphate phosphodiesterase